MKKRQGFYSISVVAKMFAVHQQTIRMYEKEGLLTPKRSDGNTRLFSEEDVERLEEIINLTHKMGVNLAGVEVILKLQKKIARMQQDMNKLFVRLDGEMETETEIYKVGLRKQAERLVEIKQQNADPLVKKMAQEAVVPMESLKKRKATKKPIIEEDDLQQDLDVVDDWKIDYDSNE